MDLQAIPEPSPAPAIEPAKAFALLVETACEQFEVLQAMVGGEFRLATSIPTNDVWEQVRLSRPEACIRMALAKSFVANVIRARRISEHGPAYLIVERIERRRFLKAIEGILRVRDVNEHGYDINAGDKAKRRMHRQYNGLLDETSLVIFGPTRF